MSNCAATSPAARSRCQIRRPPAARRRSWPVARGPGGHLRPCIRVRSREVGGTPTCAYAGTARASRVCAPRGGTRMGTDMATSSPRRVQLRRTRGWRKPPGAVVISRPGKWGNPYRVSEHGLAGALARYRRHLREHPELVEAARRELAGRTLACWCPPERPCHGDILLEVVDGRAP